MRVQITTAAVVAVLSLAGAASAGTFDIQPLGPVEGMTDVYATDINNAGQAVGYIFDASGNRRAVRWDDGVANVLPDAGQARHSEAYRINNLGQIVGLSMSDGGSEQAAMWNADGSIVPIGALPGGGYSFANDITDGGLVVGSSTLGAGGQHAFTWTAAGGLVDYGSFDSDNAQYFAGFNAANESGKFVGTGYRLFSPFHAAMGQEGVLEVIDISPQAQFSMGMGLDVNEAGVMVGYQNDGSGAPEAAIFNGDGTYVGLGHLGLGESWASAINDEGIIVGRAFGDVEGEWVTKAFVYIDGTMHDLMDFVDDGSGWELFFSADGINDRNQIVGSGIYNGEIRGYVITIPEPGAAGLLAAAGLALVQRRRR